MKLIHYAGDTLLTGDAIADALVDYAAALAREETSTAVMIPVRVDGGGVDQVSVLLGPASQIVAAPEHSEYDEIVDDELVSFMASAASRLSGPQPISLALNVDHNDRVIRDLEQG
jgi:hypothetical protein